MENSNDEEEFNGTPPELRAIAQKTSIELLPKQSKDIYDSNYKHFSEWRKLKNAGISENVVLAYFSHLKEKYKSSTLWSKFSCLKATIKLYDNIDISNYCTVIAFLKRQSEGYKPKKSKVLLNENIEAFLNTAPNEMYLGTKVSTDSNT